jgi:hypothetical protein
MKPLPYTAEMLAVAMKVIWFESAEKALSDTARFMAYLMTYGTVDEILIVKKHVGDEPFREALDHAPPGIMDARSWAYWNVMAGRYPVPPRPQRVFPD